MQKDHFNSLKQDIPASIVVFLVAVPLCLGIALASGAPLMGGVIAGIVGGIVVGSLSGSSLGVSGPAAGLAVIVLGAIATLGSYEIFLLAVVLGGLIQLILGYAKAGIIGHYFPNSVIRGMLSAIGIIIFLKQIPHAMGYDANPEGEMSFVQPDGETTFSELVKMLDFLSPGPIIITAVALSILLIWETKFMKKQRWSQVIPGPLVATLAGIGLYVVFQNIPSLSLSTSQVVSLPVAGGFSELTSLLTFPDFSQFANQDVWIIAFTIAAVASLETLLSVEATDKLDPYKRVTPTNRELKAQGIGNIISGLIGGLPVTQVIVRSSANVQSGGKTKKSAIIHGFLLLIAITAIPTLLNMIPLASLAAILFVVGYKLAKPALFKYMYKQGWYQFIPFIVTILAILLTDLLVGVIIGLAVAMFHVLYTNYRTPYFIKPEEHEEGEILRIRLSEHVTFLNKASILQTLNHVPDNSKVIVDASGTVDIDNDVMEIIENFKENAKYRNVELELIGMENIEIRNQLSAFKQVVKEKEEKKRNKKIA